MPRLVPSPVLVGHDRESVKPMLTAEMVSERYIYEETSFHLSGFKFMPKLVFDKAKLNSIYFLISLKKHKCDMG